jgi:general nucleoside transport system permease protein
VSSLWPILSAIFQGDFIATSVRVATPIALAAIGGTISERSGVVNIALEGIMLVGAFFGVVAALATGSTWVGVGAAVLAGVLFAAVHAFVSITLKADQVVSGTAINILALGVTGFLMTVLYGHPGTTDPITTLPAVIPFFGPTTGVVGAIWNWIYTAFLSYSAIEYFAVFAAIFGQWAMYNTRWGVRLRALGEHPRAADTVGINVIAGRYWAVLVSGALGGLAGAELSLAQVGTFTENMTNGRGFIALAANIFGRWTPIGSYLASLLFGAAEALEIKLQLFSSVITIPPQFFLMIPYILTVIVLAGAMGRAVAPKAVGKPYEKE